VDVAAALAAAAAPALGAWPEVPPGDIAVYQSLADHEPDVDGIFRLTKPIPFDFLSAPGRPLGVAVPWGALAPYNAQATLLLRPALWSALLPVTVHGRVSDIWRGYFAQRLLRDVVGEGRRLAFLPPAVTQIRNPHDPLRDMNAELPLYFQSLQLVRFLGEWRGSRGASLPQRFEELMVALYERRYVEEPDVTLAQQWCLALLQVGYRFPEVGD